MSRSKQETLLLEERIEQIRKKNEEIKRRHLEVEEDKQNAAKLNALVQITSPTEDWPIGGRSPPQNHGTNRSRHSELYVFPQNSNSSNPAKCYTFGEGDGPPPDPTYKFLADAERDLDRNYSRQQQQRRGRVNGRSRGAFIRDRDRESSHWHGGRGDVPRPEYEAWRAERNRIDSDRINRQKTAEGHWRREWDNEKITQEEEDAGATLRSSRGRGSRRGADWNSYHDYRANPSQDRVRSGDNFSRPTQVSERGGGGCNVPRSNRGILRGKRHIPAQTFSPQGNMGQLEDNAIPACSDRNVISIGESIKISVQNDSPTPPLRRVKVNAPVVGGTGRVGPRQKIRISYSSQSEDEAPHSRIIEQQCNRTSNNVNVTQDCSNTNKTNLSSSKPPLPPITGLKVENPKPKRQRTKRLEQDTKLRKRGGKREDVTLQVSDCLDNKEEEETVVTVGDSQKGIESGGDDSWEDVTTTSGNESTCEELSPRSKNETSIDVVSNLIENSQISEELNNTVREISTSTNGEIDDIKEISTSTNCKIDDIKEISTSTNGELDDIKEISISTNGEIDDIKEISTSTNGEIDDIKEISTSTNGKIDDIKEISTSTNGKIDDIKEISTSTNGEIDDIKEISTSTNGKIDDIKEISTSTNGEIDDIKEISTSTNGKIDDIKEISTSTNGEIDDIKEISTSTNGKTCISTESKKCDGFGDSISTIDSIPVINKIEKIIDESTKMKEIDTEKSLSVGNRRDDEFEDDILKIDAEKSHSNLLDETKKIVDESVCLSDDVEKLNAVEIVAMLDKPHRNLNEPSGLKEEENISIELEMSKKVVNIHEDKSFSESLNKCLQSDDAEKVDVHINAPQKCESETTLENATENPL